MGGASYLILGAGKFGSLACARLARQDDRASFWVVDQDPEALAALQASVPVRVQPVVAPAAAFLAQNLTPEAPWDWIIPMVPEHVAFAWLESGPLKGAGWQTVPVPEAVGRVTPAARRGPRGEWYLSRARYLCPDDCLEEALCPVSGESREVPLYRELAACGGPEAPVLVIPSRQLAPGVGGYPPRDLLEMVPQLPKVARLVLIATACRCHGVVHGLARPHKESRD